MGNAYVVQGEDGLLEIVDETEVVGLSRDGGIVLPSPVPRPPHWPLPRSANSPAHATAAAPPSSSGPLKALPPSAFPSWWSNYAAPLVAAYDATNQLSQANLRAMTLTSFLQHLLTIAQRLTQAAQGIPSTYGLYPTAVASINSAKNTLASLSQGGSVQQIVQALASVSMTLAQLIQQGGAYVAQQYRQQNVKTASTSFWSRLFGSGHRAM